MDLNQWKEDKLKRIDKKLKKDVIKTLACLGVGAFLVGRGVAHGVDCGISLGFSQMLELCEPMDEDPTEEEDD